MAQLLVAALAFGLAPRLSLAQQGSFTPDRGLPVYGGPGGGWRGGPGIGQVGTRMFAPAIGGVLVTLPPPSAEGGGAESSQPWRHRRPKPRPPHGVIVERPPPRWGAPGAPLPPAAAHQTAAQRRAPRPPTPALLAHAFPPPPGEARFRRDEILVSTAPALAPAAVSQILRRHRLTELETTPLSLTGATLRLWRIPDRRAVAAVVAELQRESLLAEIQPNYLYALEDDATSPAPPAVEEYWLAKLDADPSLDLGRGDPIRVAVIDTAIDEAHPDLQGAVEARFDAIGGGEPPHALGHGTSIAGAIAGRGRVKGVAPTVRILSARAFDSDATGADLGSTFAIVKAIDWAARSRAKVINMSFAGPPDPALHTILAAAAARGPTLVAAAGNAGPKSPPLYPAADASVISVSATDESDAVYPMANAGPSIAVAAPGVDVLLPASHGGYAMQTGTSVSAALVSGVAALVLERQPGASPSALRAVLERTARPIAAAGKDRVGAGLVDARLAVQAAAARGEPSAPSHSAAQGF